jgi:hypothetical protein
MMSRKLKIAALIAVGLIVCLFLIIYFINRDKVYEYDLADNVNNIDEAYSYVTERISEIDSDSVLISYGMIYRADDLESPESYEFEFKMKSLKKKVLMRQDIMLPLVLRINM